MFFKRRDHLLPAIDPHLMGSNIEADADALHVVRHGSREAHVLIAGSNINAALLTLAMQLNPQRLPDTVRDDGVIESIGKLRLSELRCRPVGGLLRLVEHLT